MRKPQVGSRVPIPPYSKARARRRRLHRGIELWDQDRRLCAERTQRAILLTFTITGDWQTEAQGRMRRFWQDVRNTWLGTRYFCWAELTRAGQLHYQAWWINPPHMKRVNLISWVKRHWGSDRTGITFPHHSQPADYLSSYVKKYVYKMGSKAYQQQYETMPSSLRTFMCQRFEIPRQALLDHRDFVAYEYVPESTYRGQLQPAYLITLEHVEHQVPNPGYCRAILERRTRKRVAWHLPSRRSGLPPKVTG